MTFKFKSKKKSSIRKLDATEPFEAASPTETASQMTAIQHQTKSKHICRPHNHCQEQKAEMVQPQEPTIFLAPSYRVPLLAKKEADRGKEKKCADVTKQTGRSFTELDIGMQLGHMEKAGSDA